MRHFVGRKPHPEHNLGRFDTELFEAEKECRCRLNKSE